MLLVFVIGYFTGRSNKAEVIDQLFNTLKKTVTGAIAGTVGLSDRKLVLMENPSLINRIMEGGSFGNENFSVSAAQNMFGKDDDAIEDNIDKTTIKQVSQNVWTIHLPIVNCSVIETHDGLIIIDTGMRPAGPAVLKSIKTISQKPIHTIIYTHGHVDHAYGTWALMEDGTSPQVIAHENLPARFKRYIALRGSLAKYMSQPLVQMPEDSSDFIWPTRTFKEDIELNIGGTNLMLRHFEGETDDQLLVWIPEQVIVFCADYYQGFLPNAGNGKRIQRNIGEWINALNYMSGLQAKILIPSHGDVIYGNKATDALTIHAEALKYIYDYAINSLNQGLRKDQIVDQFHFPDRFSNHPLLKEQYVTAKDICKMVIMQYTGWWDDIPSHWSPAPIDNQAASIVQLAGGIDNLIQHIHRLIPNDLSLASHFVDWAYYALPNDPRVHDLIMEIYKKRILDERSMTQEMLVYLDHMAEVRAKMK